MLEWDVSIQNRFMLNWTIAVTEGRMILLCIFPFRFLSSRVVWCRLSFFCGHTMFSNSQSVSQGVALCSWLGVLLSNSCLARGVDGGRVEPGDVMITLEFGVFAYTRLLHVCVFPNCLTTTPTASHTMSAAFPSYLNLETPSSQHTVCRTG